MKADADPRDVEQAEDAALTTPWAASMAASLATSLATSLADSLAASFISALATNPLNKSRPVECISVNIAKV